MSSLLTRINQVRANLDVLELFAHNHPVSDTLSLYPAYDAEPTINLLAPHYDPDQTSEFLSLIGDTFGRDGWLATFDRYDNRYDWSKTIDGVKVIVQDAAASDKPLSFPVPPTAFPLMLKEHNAPTESSDDDVMF